MKTLRINFPISGTRITIPFKAVCSVTNTEFEGNIVIEYHLDTKVLEFVNAEKTITKLSRKKQTVEEFAHEVFRRVKASISPKYLKVLVDVTKSKSHRPVEVWIEDDKTHSN